MIEEYIDTDEKSSGVAGQVFISTVGGLYENEVCLGNQYYAAENYKYNLVDMMNNFSAPWYAAFSKTHYDEVLMYYSNILRAAWEMVDDSFRSLEDMTEVLKPFIDCEVNWSYR